MVGLMKETDELIAVLIYRGKTVKIRKHRK